MVNINTVYETVLSILNKEQRGYLDSEEFNRLAVQVQREIFEGYFLKNLNAPGGGTDYSDPDKNIDEKVHVFEASQRLGERSDNISFFEYPADLYRMGIVYNAANNVIIDEVSHKDAVYLNLSHLTAPTEKQPIYTREAGGIKVYPDTDDNSVNNIVMNYLKVPTDPVWNFNAAEFNSTQDIVYDPSTSVNFELHPSEQHELVIRILAYAGVVVREPAVTGFAQQIEQKIAATEQ